MAQVSPWMASGMFSIGKTKPEKYVEVRLKRTLLSAGRPSWKGAAAGRDRFNRLGSAAVIPH
jgi:hypothetical protein